MIRIGQRFCRVSTFSSSLTYHGNRMYSIHSDEEEIKVPTRRKRVAVFGSRYLSRNPSQQDTQNEYKKPPTMLQSSGDIDQERMEAIKNNKVTDQFTYLQLFQQEDQSQDSILQSPELQKARNAPPPRTRLRNQSGPPISKRVFQQKFTPKEVKKSYVQKETMFWIEILQRGRSYASEQGIEPRVACKEFIKGLSVAEWFGFIDKYFSDDKGARALRQYGSRMTTELDGFNNPIDFHPDPRFNKSTGRNVEDVFPDMKNAMLNSSFFEDIKYTQDPMQIHRSLTKMFSNMGLTVEPETPSLANRFRQKPTGLQEQYLANLLSRCGSKEFEQVQQKKLYQSEETPADFNTVVSEMMTEANLLVADDDEYYTRPAYSVPEEFRVPTLHEEVDKVLKAQDSPGDNPIPNAPAPTVKTRNAKRDCRVCQGMNLEPMNGPLLMKLVDDCGMVLPRRQTKLCLKHQKKVASVMARSIAMGVFSWKKGPLRYLDPFNPPVDDEEIVVPTTIQKGV